MLRINSRSAKAAQAHTGTFRGGTQTRLKSETLTANTNPDSDKLLAAMIANLERAKEPALIVKLREAVDRIQAARRRCP